MLHIVCTIDDIRPCLSTILFKDGFAYATNTHILVKLDLNECCNFSDEEKEILNGKQIHKNQFAQLLKYDLVVVKEEGFVACKSSDISETCFRFINPARLPNLKYPDVDRVIQDALNKPRVAQNQIGIDISYIDKCNKIFSTKKTIMQFGELHQPIIIKCADSKDMALIMPYAF